jgi:hypothetical protein
MSSFLAIEDDEEDDKEIKHYIKSIAFIRLQHFFDQDVDSLQGLLSYTSREAKWHHRRINWETHVMQLQHENLFKRTYRMSLRAFHKLTALLGKNIIVDEVHCPVDEFIYPEIVVAVGLRYLSGGSSLDLKTVYGISLSSVYRCQNLSLKPSMHVLSWISACL